MKNSIFETDGLSKTYGLTPALKISSKIEIPRGKLVCVLGHSGSGKSTLLNLLALLEDHDRDGQLIFNSHLGKSFDYSKTSEAKKSEIRNRAFSVAFQDGHLIGHITTLQNIELGMSLAGHSAEETSSRSTALTKQMNLSHRNQARPQQLSGGEYQRAAIARSLAGGPEVIFADEPTGNLDTDTAERVMQTLSSWTNSREENSMVLVTHDIKLASKFGEYFVILEDGDMKASFLREELLNLSKESYPERYNEDPTIAMDQCLADHLNRTHSGKIASSEEKFSTNNSNGKGSPLRAALFLAQYAFRDLFPIKVWPFQWPVFIHSFKNSIFSALTIASIAILVTVLLMGIGIFKGIQSYQEETTAKDIRANRLLATLDTGSKVELLDEAMKETISSELLNIKIKSEPLDGFQPWKESKAGQPAVSSSHLSTQAQLFIHNSTGETVGAQGTTVDPNSPLLEKLNVKGVPLQFNPIENSGIEGIIVSSKWLQSALKMGPEETPTEIIVEYGKMGSISGSSRENLPVLAVVDELPDGSFLIAPDFWHKFRDGLWRPGFKRAEFLFEGNSTEANALVKHAKDFFADRPALGLDCYTGSSSTDGSWRIRISSARADGFRGKYWNEVIIPNAIKPMLKDFGYEISEEFDLKGEDVNPVRSPLDYDRLVVYLNDLSAVSEVSNALREGSAGLVVDPYVENSYRSIHRTKMLSGLILFIVATCALFLCVANIFLMFYQNVLRKRHEIGILKAFGSTKGRISMIFSLEAFYLCSGGFLFGWIFASYAGQEASQALLDIFELNYHSLYQVQPQVAWFLFIALFVLCLVISFFATFKTSGQTANSLLRNKS